MQRAKELTEWMLRREYTLSREGYTFTESDLHNLLGTLLNLEYFTSYKPTHRYSTTDFLLDQKQDEIISIELRNCGYRIYSLLKPLVTAIDVDEQMDVDDEDYYMDHR